MVVYGDRQDFLRAFLPDYVLVQDGFDSLRLWKFVTALIVVIFQLLADNVITQFDTLITDKYRRTGDQLADLMLALAAK